ncbi:MAG TPA: hypothetical protein VEC95_08235 [Terriglobales bacterium]|nr:hypothetical protein [Terriglobales bacterium]
MPSRLEAEVQPEQERPPGLYALLLGHQFYGPMRDRDAALAGADALRYASQHQRETDPASRTPEAAGKLTAGCCQSSRQGVAH